MSPKLARQRYVSPYLQELGVMSEVGGWGEGFRVRVGFLVSRVGFWELGSGFRDGGFGMRRFRVWGLWFTVEGHGILGG